MTFSFVHRIYVVKKYQIFPGIFFHSLTFVAVTKLFILSRSSALSDIIKTTTRKFTLQFKLIKYLLFVCISLKGKGNVADFIWKLFWFIRIYFEGLLDKWRVKTRHTFETFLSRVKAIRPWMLCFAFIDLYEYDAYCSTPCLDASVTDPLLL